MRSVPFHPPGQWDCSSPDAIAAPQRSFLWPRCPSRPPHMPQVALLRCAQAQWWFDLGILCFRCVKLLLLLCMKLFFWQIRVRCGPRARPGWSVGVVPALSQGFCPREPTAGNQETQEGGIDGQGGDAQVSQFWNYVVGAWTEGLTFSPVHFHLSFQLVLLLFRATWLPVTRPHQLLLWDGTFSECVSVSFRVCPT